MLGLLGLLAALAVPAAASAASKEKAAVREASNLPDAACVLALRRGRIALQTGTKAVAAAALRDALAACRGRLEPLLLAVEARAAAGESRQLQEAVTEVEAAMRKTESTAGLQALALLATSEGTSPEELESISARLQAMAREGGKDPKILRVLARVQVRLGDATGLRQTLEAILAARPDPWTRWALAGVCANLHAWSCAESQLEILARSDDTLGFLAASRLVRVKAVTGRVEEAAEMALGLARADLGSELVKGSVVRTLIDAAWLAWDAGDIAGARFLFAKVREIDPDNQIARQAADLVLANPATRVANQRRRKEVLKQSGNADELLAEGAKLLAAGDARGAWDLLDRGARLAPDSAVGWYNLGIASQRLERWEDAARAFGQAVRLDSENPTARLGLGTALATVGRCAEAVPVLRRLAQAHPEVYQAQYYLWKCYTSLGNRPAAAKALQRYNAGRAAGGHKTAAGG